MKTIKKLLLIFIIGLLITSCTVQRPVYKTGTDKEKYNKELVKYYQKQQNEKSKN